MAALVVMALPQAHAAGVSGQGTWETTLQGRDLDGDDSTIEAYYDTVLNVTWLADANYAQTSGYDDDGNLTWDDAKTWADDLEEGGYSEWRLPTMVDTGTKGCNFSYAGGTDCGHNVQTKDAVTGAVYSEMAYMYYVTLGNKGYCELGNASCSAAQPGWGLSNTGPFSNVQSDDFYWFGVQSDTSFAWSFYPYSGYQSDSYMANELSAWAVHSGDVGVAVTAVPEPQTYALALAGLAAAALLARKRRA